VPASSICPGDKVMQVENDYDKDVYNGDRGVVSRIDMEEGELNVDFDGREVAYGFGKLDELALAYATTIHKSQGSEYPAVVIPLSTQHYPMLQRNLVYTGVTRRQAPREARRAAEGARHCGQGKPSEAAVVEAAGLVVIPMRVARCLVGSLSDAWAAASAGNATRAARCSSELHTAAPPLSFSMHNPKAWATLD
jgi:hypothetical protein